jgi:SAM-dependent methyltransferase
VSSTYGDVDQSGDPAGAAAWMDEMASWPAVRAYKRFSLELLASAAPVVDVGCGVGEDARAIGAIGVDPSMTMLTEARRRGGPFVRGDVLALPIASGALGGVRTDRVLQHVAEPDLALAEFARLLRAGGMVVTAEPDQGTLTIDGTDPELTPAIVEFRKASIQHPLLGAELAERLQRLGFTNVDRRSFLLEITDPALAFGLPGWAAMLAERGTWKDEEARRFERSLTSDAFRYSFEIVVTWATK